MTIYFCDICPVGYKPQQGLEIDFKPPQWESITTLGKEHQTQKFVLSTPKRTRFVALAWEGFVHLVEVEIYAYAGKFSYHCCPFVNNDRKQLSLWLFGFISLL